MRTPGPFFLVTLAALTLALACTPPTPPDASDGGSTGTTEGLVTTIGLVTEDSTTRGSDPDSSAGPDASTSDATGPGPGTTTTGPADSTTTSDSTSAEDSTGDDPALGTISGDCGLIDAMELDSPSPFTFENAIDLRRLGFDYDLLTPEGQQVFDAGNLGGSSLHSEVLAFEVLARCEGAALLATEAEIQYTDPMGIKTDLLVEIDGRVVGVSVTRAVGFPFDAPYTDLQANTLLTDKLQDVLESTANVAPRDAWSKQILHVIAYADMHAQSIFAAYGTLPPELTADTVLVVTVTHGNDAIVY